jgi:hypothetical protein
LLFTDWIGEYTAEIHLLFPKNENFITYRKYSVQNSRIKWRNQMGYKIFRRLTVWAGGAVIGILVIPAGALLLLISGIWSVTDRIADWLDRKTKR